MESERAVLLFLEANERATIACVRSLCARGVSVLLLRKRRANGRISHFNYFEHSVYRKYILDGFWYDDPKNSELFISSLQKVLSSYPGIIIFPLGEDHIRCILKFRDMLAGYDYILPCPEYDAYVKVSNKYSFQNLISEYGLDVPKILTDPKMSDIPFVLKPKSAKNSKKSVEFPELILSERDYCKFLAKGYENVFFQEYIDGPSVYYCALYNRGNRVANFGQINIHQQPCGKSVIKACPFDFPASVIQKTDQMMKDLFWTGVIMVEFKLCKNKYYGIELNPRFWGPLQLSLDNGVDFPYLLYCMATGSQTHAKENSKNVGYYWVVGYLYGAAMMIFWGGRFQLYKTEDVLSPVTFKDVWLRRDTIAPFFKDIFHPIEYYVGRFLKLI